MSACCVVYTLLDEYVPALTDLLLEDLPRDPASPQRGQVAKEGVLAQPSKDIDTLCGASVLQCGSQKKYRNPPGQYVLD